MKLKKIVVFFISFMVVINTVIPFYTVTAEESFLQDPQSNEEVLQSFEEIDSIIERSESQNELDEHNNSNDEISEEKPDIIEKNFIDSDYNDISVDENDENKAIILFKEKINKELIINVNGTIHDEFENIPALAASLSPQAIETVKNNPDVIAVEENELYHTQGQTIDWGVQRVEAPTSWSSGFTGKGVKVAVIDSGIDTTHPDLNVVGCYSATNAPTCEDSDGHGTHVAGIIGAKNNNRGTVGVAPDVDIYAARVSNLNDEIWTVDVIAAIDWAISQKVDIINMSLGSEYSSPTLRQAVDRAFDEEILIVAAAGNDYQQSVNYPAAFPNVIAVSATNSSDAIASFSNIGEEIEVSAPGNAIRSTYINNSYATISGTSMASPHVAGVLALLMEAYPEMQRDELRTTLRDTSLDLGVAGKDIYFGYGLVQAPSKLFQEVPDSPANVKVNNISSHSVGLTWDKQENVHYYSIDVEDVGEFQSSNPELLIEGLTANKQYEITVYAVNNIGASEPSSIEILTLITSPELSSENITHNTVDLFWLEENDATHFELYRDDTLIYAGSEHSFIDTGLEHDTEYSYYIYAKNDDNTSARSEVHTVKTNVKPLTEEEKNLWTVQEGLQILGFLDRAPTGQLDDETEAALRGFQEYYGLEITGEVDETTLEKLNGILLTPFQNGGSHDDVITLKKNLSRLGFHVSDNPNTRYGPFTVNQVKEFQKYYGLMANGIGDEKTLAKINEILSTPFQNGGSHDDVITLKKNLSRLGFHVSDNPNTKYGPATERKVREYQTFYGLRENGIADEITVAKINEHISTPMSRGDYRQDVIDLKVKLGKLGFVVSANPTPQFGPSTEQAVKDFQSYYGLISNGIVEEATLAKIDEVLASPLQNGSRHEDVIRLKENLSRLGFHVSNNPNIAYGSTTTNRVKEFQKYYGLVVNGIADEITLEKIDEILATPFIKGSKHEAVITLKENLSRLGFHVSDNPNISYGPATERKVKEFQEFYSLRVNGIVDNITQAKIEKLLSTPMSRGDYRQDVIDLKVKLGKLGFVVSANPTPQFGPATEQAVKDFQSYYGLTSNGIVDEDTMEKIDELLSNLS
ncbi:minor extracellular protease Epr [Evansella caseinilytica]|uniref:Minor extracellular protease Epr n=1 Tax=Evansella caseinilytica TaxID=1503961 RepID=A0A1H3TZ36_9BACI|nr:peptidoglycan-binding protein [Evansella caseinilytica]SDZ55460.1 minor extracellular protease Epr [Evansella caseinilytica]